MKVLNVNTAIDSLSGGGTAERTFQLARFLAGRNVRCTVLALKISKNSVMAAKALPGVNVILLPCLLRRFYLPMVSPKKLKAIIADADIIHLIGHWTLLNALVYYLARKLNKPYVFCPAGALAIFGRSKVLKKLYQCLVGRKIVENASCCIAITAEEIALFHEHGVRKDHITLIPNGIHIPDYTLPDNSPSVLPQWPNHIINIAKSKYLLFVGRLNYIKGPDLLLQAFKNIAMKYSEIHLVFAGPDGGMLKKLEDEVRASQLDHRVHFIGYVGGRDKLALYRQALLLAIPSRHEAMSLVVLEAGALTRPVLLTDQCGFDEVMQVNGGLVVTATVQGIEEGLMELLSPESRLDSLGMNLKDHIAAHYTWDLQTDKLIACYKNILHAIPETFDI